MEALIREVADPLIAAGATPDQVRAAIYARTGIGIGGGGGGNDPSVPRCRICGASGGGGHGGGCPNPERGGIH